MYETGGIVAAVCDGVSGLVPVKLSDGKYLVNGKELAVNGNNVEKGIQQKLTTHGAIISKEKLAIDGRIITAKGVRPKNVAREILKLTEGQ